MFVGWGHFFYRFGKKTAENKNSPWWKIFRCWGINFLNQATFFWETFMNFSQIIQFLHRNKVCHVCSCVKAVLNLRFLGQNLIILEFSLIFMPKKLFAGWGHFFYHFGRKKLKKQKIFPQGKFSSMLDNVFKSSYIFSEILMNFSQIIQFLHRNNACHVFSCVKAIKKALIVKISGKNFKILDFSFILMP